MTSFRLVCPICRLVTVGCEHEKLVVSSKWRAPSKNNDRAWKRIEAGEIWWDRNAITRKAKKARSRWNEIKFGGKEAVLEELRLRKRAVQARIAQTKKEIETGPPDCQHEFCMDSYKRAISFYSHYHEAYEGCPRGPMETT